MSLKYEKWNDLLLERFFYQSAEGEVIRIGVTKEWFDSLDAENHDARNDLVRAVCDQLGGKKFDELFRTALLFPARHLPLLAFFCIPYGEIDDTDEQGGAGAYWGYLRSDLINGEAFQDHSFDAIKEEIGRFRSFSDYIPELFEKLKTWADNKSEVKGSFCFARLHARSDNKVSYFQSQVLLRLRDERRLLSSFCRLPYRNYTPDDLLMSLRD